MRRFSWASQDQKRLSTSSPRAASLRWKSVVPDISSYRSEAFKHTARGLEAIGFNPHASMYHVDREYSPESDDEDRVERKKNKQKKSFLKKLVGGGKEKGEKI